MKICILVDLDELLTDIFRSGAQHGFLAETRASEAGGEEGAYFLKLLQVDDFAVLAKLALVVV